MLIELLPCLSTQQRLRTQQRFPLALGGFCSQQNLAPSIGNWPWRAMQRQHTLCRRKRQNYSKRLVETMIRLPAEGVVIAVMGAVGGAGTSTLASAIALSCENAVLIDADPSSGGVDLLLGIEESPGMRWNDLVLRQGDVRSDDLIAAFPKTAQGLSVLTVARGNDVRTIDDTTLNAVIRSLRGHTSVVVDLLRGTSIADSALDAADCVVLCIPAEIRAVAAAEKLVQQMRARNIKVVGVLRHRLWSSVDATDVERAAHLDVVAEIGNLSRLTKTTEYTGLSSPLPRSLKAAATAVLEEAQAA